MERPASRLCRAGDPAALGAGGRRALPARHPHARAARASAGAAQGALGHRRAKPSSPAAPRRLPAAVRKSIVAETLAVLREPAFAALFGPEARAEVAIVAEIPHPSGAGRRCGSPARSTAWCGSCDSILIVDYKTNRPPPKDVGQGCGSLPAATRGLPAGRQPHFLTTTCQGRHSLDGRPENHGDSGRDAAMPPSSGSGSSTRPTLTPEGGLPTFRAAIPDPPCVPPKMRPHGATQRRLVQCQWSSDALRVGCQLRPGSAQVDRARGGRFLRRVVRTVQGHGAGAGSGGGRHEGQGQDRQARRRPEPDGDADTTRSRPCRR